MMGRTHALIGASTVWLMTVLPSGITNTSAACNEAVLVVVAATSALLPDLDARHSLLSNWTVAGIRPLTPLSWLVHSTFGHRGALHSCIGVATVTVIGLVVAVYFGWQIGLVMWTGYLSHLIADACTIRGVPLLPGKPFRVHLLPKQLRLVTGSSAELCLATLFGTAVLALLVLPLLTGELSPLLPSS